MERKIAEKFFNNSATPEETEWVLEWFDTPEGRKYLEERLDNDFNLLDEENIRSLINELESDRLYYAIQENIKTRRMVNERKSNLLGPLLKVAATIFVVFTASLFFYITYDPNPESIVENEPILFQTTEDQQREITLGDGSVVRLNSNSEILIPADFLHGSREVILMGEAYFEVEHDPGKPFFIHTNQSSIKVLGTVINVRSYNSVDNVQVAVTEGRVALISNTMVTDDQTVILEAGQYGYLDLNNNEIFVEDFAIENYLAWKSGKLVFEDLSLDKICFQLNKLYEVECTFEKESFADLKLTANFSDDSLDRTLSVIALSLDINYRMDNDEVIWIDERGENEDKQER